MKADEVKKEIEKALALHSETGIVEFKMARGGFPKTPVRKTLSAFGNTRGGIIVFGVEEDDAKRMHVIGLSDAATFQERMTQLASDEMSAVVRLDYFNLDLEGKTILAVFVPECGNHQKPYYFKELGIPKGAFVRDGNTDRQMTDAEARSYIKNSPGDNFDQTCIEELNLDALSKRKIRELLKKSAERADRDIDLPEEYVSVLKNIGVAAYCDGEPHPTLAGFLIFADDTPQKELRFERYTIRCVRYKGSGVHTDIIDSSDIAGTLDEQIEGMQAFILRNIPKSAEIVGTKRVERYEYPAKAIREIVANAVIHRDYRITGTYTQVNIFEDRVEVFNPGNLPPGVTIENIRSAQESRNQIIAARLKDLDYLEEYGRGIDIVFTEMAQWGLLPPLFKNTANSFKVILPGKKLSELNDRQLRIWELLVEKGRITRRDAEELLGGVSQNTIASDLRIMRDLGLIQQIGEPRNTYYNPSF